MVSQHKIGIIGRVDPNCTMSDGQTVKTRTVWKMLCGRYGDGNIVVVDTLNYKKEPFRVALEYRRCMKECEDVVVLLSRNGRKLFFPLLAKQAANNGKRIYHNLIGGSLADSVRSDTRLASQLSSFQVNWVESREMVAELAGYGVDNCSFLPNFKRIVPLREDELVVPLGSPRRLCMFTRMTEKKGIREAIDATRILCDRDGVGAWSLDLYGPLEQDFQEEFESMLAEAPFARYCGCADPDESVKVLRGYWAMLFPTRWESEGFPGTIIDAFDAGLPVVASRWPYYHEMLCDGKTGFSYEYGGDAAALAAAIDCLADNEYRMMDYKVQCLKRAELYSAEKLFGNMVARIEEGWR